MSYKFKKAAARAKMLDAAAVGAVFETIAEADGRLTPAAVVEAGRPPDSALHKFFEWDDSAAATAYREHQAAYLIRAVVKVDDVTHTEIRAFVHVEDVHVEEVGVEDVGVHRGGVYQPIEVAMNDPGMRAQVLHRALMELRAWERRYAELEELADLFSAVRATVAKLEEVAQA